MKSGEKILSATGAEALFTTAEHLKRYLSGFLTEGGFVLVDERGTTLYTDRRYLEAARAKLKDVRVQELTKKTTAFEVLSAYQKVAIPFSETPLKEFENLKKCGATFVDADAAFTAAMVVKTEEELGYIQKASKIAERAYEKLLPQIKEGQTEREVAALLDYLMKRLGADGNSFDTIVAFGAHAAVPHHATGDTPLKFGDEILIDFGCKVEGYCSDMTRTVLFGDDGRHEPFKKAYAAVLTAHEKVLKELRAGMTAGQADAIAREYLVSQGYGDYFTHSLGHGIGLKIHEPPTLTIGKETVLQDGMVFSDEPGVYIEGELGIRIEDTVTLKDGKAVSLMTTKKDLMIL